MHHLTDWIIQFGESLSAGVQKLLIVLVSMLPIIELKGTIPIAEIWGIPLFERFGLAYLGSCLPVIPLLFLLRPIIRWMYKQRFFKGFATWLEERSKRKGQIIYDYAYIGLFLFVAVPLPTTGVWTGSIVASLLKLDIKKCIPIILAGNLIAGTVIVLLGPAAFLWVVLAALVIAVGTFIYKKFLRKRPA